MGDLIEVDATNLSRIDNDVIIDRVDSFIRK